MYVNISIVCNGKISIHGARECSFINVTALILQLLSSLRGADVELRELYGKCLGELGAIDPGKYVCTIPLHQQVFTIVLCSIFRLDLPTVSPVKVVKFYEVDEEFQLDLLQELARAYTASSNTRTQVFVLPLCFIVTP